MMKSHGAIRNGVAAALLFATPAAFACSPVKAIGVYFERNATAVPSSQVLRLADWITNLRARYPNHQAMYVVGSGEPDERNPTTLGVERARHVAAVLRDNLGFDAAKIDLTERGYIEEPVGPYLKQLDKSDGVRGVQVDFLPACPHECPCQMGDPLYKPPAPR